MQSNIVYLLVQLQSKSGVLFFPNWFTVALKLASNLILFLLTKTLIKNTY